MRIVLHIDMDAFFASVEERDHPRLKGLPIVVGSDPVAGRGRGVVSTANYAARKYGIKSALPISKAWDLSQQAKRAGKPEVVFMSGSYRKYAEVSKVIFSYIATQGDLFEQTSVDEGYLELVPSRLIDGRQLNEMGSETWSYAEKTAKDIKEWVKKEQGLTCSIGVGPNKLISKIAAGVKKPDGLMMIKDEEVQDFLDPMSVRELPGVGPKTQEALKTLNVLTIKDLREKSREELVEKFGKWGGAMFEKARGIDDSPVESGGEAKSIGEQTTFTQDTADPGFILKTFKEICQSVHKTVVGEGKRFKTIAIIVRFADFQTFTRSHSIPEATQDYSVLETEALKLLLPFFDARENPKRKKFRLIGVRAEHLEEG